MFFSSKYSGYAVDSDGHRWGYIFEERLYENMRTGQRLSPVLFSLREEEILRLKEENEKQLQQQLQQQQQISSQSPLTESAEDDGDGDGNSRLRPAKPLVNNSESEVYSQDNSEYESFNLLERLLADGAGGDVDLSGRKFAPVGVSGGQSDVARYLQGIDVADNTTISGGEFYGGIGVTWTLDTTVLGSNRQFIADLPGGLTGGNGYYGQTYDNAFFWLLDRGQFEEGSSEEVSPVFPKLQVVPDPPDNMNDFRFSFHKDYIGLGSVNGPDGAVGITQYLEVTDYDVAGISPDGVLTVNATHAKMTGITFKNNDLRNHVNDILGGDHPEGVTILLHADANVMGAGPVTGFTFNNGNDHSQLEFDTGLKYGNSNYLDFAFSGVPTQNLALGEYSINLTTSKIKYRPLNGNPSTSLVPTQTKIFDVSNFGCSGSNFYLNYDGDDSTSTFIRVDNKQRGLTFDHCKFRYMTTAVRTGTVSMNKCILERTTNRAISPSGISASNSYFAHSMNKSLITVQWSDPTTTMPESSIQDCFFHLPASAHGQAVSLYGDSWQKCQMKHNIFYDCVRPLSFQPTSGSGWTGDFNNIGSFTFENNLIYNKDCPSWDASAQGQSGVAFNGNDEKFKDHSAPNDQEVTFKHNTIWTDVDAENRSRASANAITSTQMTMTGLRRSKTLFEGNIVRGLRTPTATETSEEDAQKHVHRFNKIYGMTASTDSSGRSHARTDSGLVSTGRYDTFFDEDTLSATGDLKTLAEDGGTCGIRWTAIPTPAQLDALVVKGSDVDGLRTSWGSNYAQELLPTSGYTFGGYSADDRVYAGEYKIPEGITIGRFSTAFSGSGLEVNAVTAESGTLQQFWATSPPSATLFTTAQIRFSSKDATTVYTPNYPSFVQNAANSTAWEEAFRGNDHVLRIYYTPTGGTKTLLHAVMPDTDLNNQGGYIIVASSLVTGPPGDDQAWPAAAGSMTAGDQFEISLSDQ